MAFSAVTASSRWENSSRRTSVWTSSQRSASETAAASWAWISPSTPVRSAMSRHTRVTTRTDSTLRASASLRRSTCARACASGTFLTLPTAHRETRRVLRERTICSTAGVDRPRSVISHSSQREPLDGPRERLGANADPSGGAFAVQADAVDVPAADQSVPVHRHRHPRHRLAALVPHRGHRLVQMHPQPAAPPADVDHGSDRHAIGLGEVEAGPLAPVVKPGGGRGLHRV